MGPNQVMQSVDRCDLLTLMRAASPARAFGIYAALCAASWVFCSSCTRKRLGESPYRGHRTTDEPHRLSLEEVYAVFEDGFGVAESQRLRRDRALRSLMPLDGDFGLHPAQCHPCIRP